MILITTITKVVNIVNADYDMYIGRPSKWGNPFIIDVDGTRQTVIRKYEEYLRGNAQLMSELPNLRGKILGCHCKPKACHGDVIIKILQELDMEAIYDT